MELSGCNVLKFRWGLYLIFIIKKVIEMATDNLQKIIELDH